MAGQANRCGSSSARQANASSTRSQQVAAEGTTATATTPRLRWKTVQKKLGSGACLLGEGDLVSPGGVTPDLESRADCVRVQHGTVNCTAGTPPRAPAGRRYSQRRRCLYVATRCRAAGDATPGSCDRFCVISAAQMVDVLNASRAVKKRRRNFSFRTLANQLVAYLVMVALLVVFTPIAWDHATPTYAKCVAPLPESVCAMCAVS